MRRFLACAATLIMASTAAPALAGLVAGAGRAEITITPDMLPIDGFNKVHDQLVTRLLLLDDGTTRFALMVVDQTALGADLVAAFKAQVAQAVDTSPDNVWIVASNSFSAPHLLMGHAEAGTLAYRAAMDRAIAQAANQAKAGLRPAQVGFSTGSSDVNVNRNVETPEGWWLGSNEHGTSDKSVSVLSVRGENQRPMAIILNYPVQSSVMDQTGGVDGGKGVTADLGGFAARRAEQLLGDGSVALFLTGASGDQAPAYTAVRHVYDAQGHLAKVDIGDQGYALAQLQGERLGTEAARVAHAAPVQPGTPQISIANASIALPAKFRPPSLKDLKPSRQFDYRVTGEAQTPYSIVRIGDTVLVGTQVQLDAVTGMAIKQRSPFPHILVVNMVNGGAKYLASAEGYKAITYQAMNSGYAPGGAEKLADRILADLKRMKRDTLKAGK